MRLGVTCRGARGARCGRLGAWLLGLPVYCRLGALHEGLVTCDRLDVAPTARGREIATRMIRNGCPLEVLMDGAPKMDIDGELVCGTGHHMGKQLAYAPCTMLHHPRKCPHDCGGQTQ